MEVAGRACATYFSSQMARVSFRVQQIHCNVKVCPAKFSRNSNAQRFTAKVSYNKPHPDIIWHQQNMHKKTDLLQMWNILSFQLSGFVVGGGAMEGYEGACRK